ncbi:MAG: hemolysin family protein [Candidatus Omnitrophica bacterium]|nr:hemolysin family protein [Candidatus Omnitrophota bacterium]MDD5487978.1 hemolysin family protein [Candidatus Omnitrophota bacterium]
MDIIIFCILLGFSAFFSGSETSFLSLDKFRIKQLESDVSPAARRVVSLLSGPYKLLVTILIGNMLVNIAASSVLADAMYALLGEKSLGVSIVSMTVIILIFGEVTPKMFALSNAEHFAKTVSLPLRFFEMLFSPLRLVFVNIAHTILRTFGFKLSSAQQNITLDEIKSFFSLGRTRGVVKEKEQDMIENILEFKELNVADIMTPRINIVALDINAPKEDLVREIKDSQNSRYPAYVHTIDNIVGIIHAKEYLLDPNVPVREILKKPFFAPESMKIDDLLRELQRRHTHLAIVTDEYGVTSGVVTVEDVLEEIVGEIKDERDHEPPPIRKIDQKTYLVDGQTHIDKVNDEIGTELVSDEVDTIGGYFTLKFGRMPQAGDRIECDGFAITVRDVSKNRITSLTFERS